jgi:hypothetical protein
MRPERAPDLFFRKIASKLLLAMKKSKSGAFSAVA